MSVILGKCYNKKTAKMDIIDTRRALYIVLGSLASIYLLINFALPRFPNAVVGTYVLQPILWGLVIWLVFRLPRYRPAGKLSLRSSLLQLALMIGGFQVILSFIGGFFCGFGKSPYSFTPLGIFTNLIFVGSMLVGMELSRAWLINRLGRRNMVMVLALMTLLYTFISLPLARITNIGGDLKSVKYLDSTCIPLLAENLLASFLAFLGGPIPALAYRGILKFFEWFCPILPDLDWVLKGLIGTAVPIIGLVVVQGFHFEKVNPNKPRRRVKEGSLTGWIITTIVAVSIIWFSLGLFAFHPTMVASGSMRPVMDVGDVAIVAKVPADIVGEGDIIQFRKEEVNVLHRVVEIEETEDARFFITKGDANKDPDTDPVVPEQVIGRVIFKIPKIGWAAIVVKGFFTG